MQDQENQASPIPEEAQQQAAQPQQAEPVNVHCSLQIADCRL